MGSVSLGSLFHALIDRMIITEVNRIYQGLTTDEDHARLLMKLSGREYESKGMETLREELQR